MSDIESSSDFRQIRSLVFDIFDEAFGPFFAHNLERQAFSPNFERRVCVFITNTFVFQTLYPLPSWQISNGGESFSSWFRGMFFGFPAPAGGTSPAENRFPGVPAASRPPKTPKCAKEPVCFCAFSPKAKNGLTLYRLHTLESEPQGTPALESSGAQSIGRFLNYEQRKVFHCI